MLRSIKYLSILLMILIALSLTACDTANVVEDTEEEIEEIIENYEAAMGGTLNVSVTRFNTLNPLFNNNYSLFQLHHLIYEGLVTFDENMDVKPQLAESWNVAPDGQSISFQLRDDIKWHDGETLTGDDVIFTINLIKGNIRNISSPSVFRTSLAQIADAREISEGVVNITFTRPFSNGLEVMNFPILPKHLFEGNNIEKINNGNFPVIGTGPFMLDEYETMRHIHLVRNESYWRQKPYIERVEAQIVPDPEAQLSVFENRDIDFAQPTSIDWAKYTKDSNARVYEYVSNNYEFLGLNFRNPLLRDKQLRKAIAYSIDRHKLISNIYLGHATVVDVPIYPLSSLYDESSEIYGYNIEEANRMLDTAGYSLNGENTTRTTEGGQPLKLQLISNKDNILREKTAYFIQDELANIGVEIDVQLLEWEEFNERVNTRNYDILLGGWELSYIPDLSFAFHSSQLDRNNFISYNNEEMDHFLEEAFRAPNRQGKETAYSKLQQYIAEEVPYVSLFFRNGAIVVRDKVKGEFKPNHYNLFIGIENWFINYTVIED